MTFITRCPVEQPGGGAVRVCSSPPPSRRARDEAATSLLGCRLQLQLMGTLPRPELDPRPPLQAVSQERMHCLFCLCRVLAAGGYAR